MSKFEKGDLVICKTDQYVWDHGVYMYGIYRVSHDYDFFLELVGKKSTFYSSQFELFESREPGDDGEWTVHDGEVTTLHRSEIDALRYALANGGNVVYLVYKEAENGSLE